MHSTFHLNHKCAKAWYSTSVIPFAICVPSTSPLKWRNLLWIMENKELSVLRHSKANYINNINIYIFTFNIPSFIWYSVLILNGNIYLEPHICPWDYTSLVKYCIILIVKLFLKLICIFREQSKDLKIFNTYVIRHIFGEVPLWGHSFENEDQVIFSKMLLSSKRNNQKIKR